MLQGYAFRPEKYCGNLSNSYGDVIPRHMHKEIEVYVDDLIAKSQEDESHIENHRKLFERLRKF